MIYRAIASAVNDPEGLGRIKVMIPAITGTDITEWIWPLIGAGYLQLPNPGDQVWVSFENGDRDAPVWIGTTKEASDGLRKRLDDLETYNAETAPADTNTTQIATTAFVIGQAGTSTPLVDGTAEVGTSLRYARQDHKHPTDSTRAPIASPNFSGTPQAPTAAAGTNTQQIASTAFVQTAVQTATAPLPPIGTVVQYAGVSDPPTGWLYCRGQEVSRQTYSALFTAIQTTYGPGNNTTTFNLPDLRGRVAVGLDSSDTDFNALNKPSGAKTHKLIPAEMPSHSHLQDSHNHTQNEHNHTQDPHGHSFAGNFQPGWSTPDDRNYSYPAAGDSGSPFYRDYGVYVTSTTATNKKTTATNLPTTATNQDTGGDGFHNNMQPYIVLNYIIRAL